MSKQPWEKEDLSTCGSHPPPFMVIGDRLGARERAHTSRNTPREWCCPSEFGSMEYEIESWDAATPMQSSEVYSCTTRAGISYTNGGVISLKLTVGCSVEHRLFV